MNAPHDMSLKQLKTFSRDVADAIEAIENNEIETANQLVQRLMDEYGISISGAIDNSRSKRSGSS